ASQELCVAGRKDEAVAAVPDEFVDEGALVGPPARIRDRYRAWADCGITGMSISTQQNEAVELMDDLAGARPATRARGRGAPVVRAGAVARGRAAATVPRLVSLDVFRGATVAGMVL